MGRNATESRPNTDTATCSPADDTYSTKNVRQHSQLTRADMAISSSSLARYTLQNSSKYSGSLKHAGSTERQAGSDRYSGKAARARTPSSGSKSKDIKDSMPVSISTATRVLTWAMESEVGQMLSLSTHTHCQHHNFINLLISTLTCHKLIVLFFFFLTLTLTLTYLKRKKSKTHTNKSQI